MGMRMGEWASPMPWTFICYGMEEEEAKGAGWAENEQGLLERYLESVLPVLLLMSPQDQEAEQKYHTTNKEQQDVAPP